MDEKPQIGPSTVVVRTEGPVFSELDGETVLLDVENGKYYGMDAIGSRIWVLLESPMAVSRMCSLLGEEFDVSADRCETDVLAFLERLSEADLVRVTEEPATSPGG